MIEFSVLKKSAKSRARLGVLLTPHGEIETPVFVPVATSGSIKTLTSEEAYETKTQLAIANTFHLHVRPGERAVRAAGGLHRFMNWSRPLLTDSGGFQVFSMGFGKDLGVGKIVKYFGKRAEDAPLIQKGARPSALRIVRDGVHFRSPLDGRPLFLGPKESIKIQEMLGADIMFAFDECTPPLASFEYAEHSLERTHRWEKISLEARRGKQALFGIVQGSRFRELRERSARFVSSIGFDGYGIGGDLGEGGKGTLNRILEWTVPILDDAKPRHLLGVGHPEDIETIVRRGIDLFDCIAPTHYARRGIAFTSGGRFNLAQSKFLRDQSPLDRRCACAVCGRYRRSYISHLMRAQEITALRLLTFHNLYFFNTFVERIRQKIKKGRI